MYLRSSKNMKSEVSLHESVGTDKEGNEITLLDLLGSTGEEISEEIEQAEEKSYLLKKMAVLNGKERYVLKLRYGLGNTVARTQREIANLMGISRSYVSELAYYKWNPESLTQASFRNSCFFMGKISCSVHS